MRRRRRDDQILRLNCLSGTRYILLYYTITYAMIIIVAYTMRVLFMACGVRAVTDFRYTVYRRIIIYATHSTTDLSYDSTCWNKIERGPDRPNDFGFDCYFPPLGLFKSSTVSFEITRSNPKHAHIYFYSRFMQQCLNKIIHEIRISLGYNTVYRLWLGLGFKSP